MHTKDWTTKYYYEIICRMVACILYAMESCAVANKLIVSLAQIFEFILL